MSTASREHPGVERVAAALDHGVPLDDVLDLVDAEIERATIEHDAAALASLATQLDKGAARRGTEGRGLTVAAARARAVLPPPVEPAAPAAAQEPNAPHSHPPVAAAEPASPVHASWIRRVAAFFADWIALFIVITIPASEIDLSTGAYVGLLVVVPVTYFAVLHWAFGQTLGKRLVGIEVRTADGSRINGGEALIRAVAQATLAITIIGFPFDSLWPLSDNRNQALHDKIVGTVVVRRRAEQIHVPSTTA